MVAYSAMLFALLLIVLFVVLARALQPPLRLGTASVYGGVSGLGGYFHPGQPAKLRSILMIVLAAAFILSSSIESDLFQYRALQSEVAWIREVAGDGTSQPIVHRQGLGAILLDRLFVDRFPDLVERAGENSAVLADMDHLSVRSLSGLIKLLLVVLLVSIVLALLQASLAASHSRGAYFGLPALYIGVVSVVFFAVFFTLLQAIPFWEAR
jgi:hypothetical protein